MSDQKIIESLEKTNKSIISLVDAVDKMIRSTASLGGKDTKRLTQVQENLFRNRSDSFNDALEETEQSVENVSDTLDKLSRAGRSYNNGIRSTYDSMKKFNENLGKSTQSLKTQSSILTGFLEGADIKNDKLDEFETKILNSAKSLQIFGNNIKKYGINSINHFAEMTEQAAKNAGFLENALRDSDNLSETIKKVMQTEDDKLTQNEKILKGIVKQSKLQGASNDQIHQHVKAVKSEINAVSKTAYKYYAQMKVVDFVNDKFGRFGSLLTKTHGPMTWFLTGLSLLASSLPAIYNQFKILADSGMIRAGIDIKQAQFDLGISFENATKIFQENARNLANVSNFKAFTRNMVEAQEGFMKLGVSTEQAAQMASDIRKNMVEGGVNIQDVDHFNKAVKVQTAAFSKLKATTGLSVEQFAAFNQEMLNSSDVQTQLNGLNEIDRLNKIKDMHQIRQQFVNLGMSAEKAQKALMTIESMGSAKVEDRFAQAAKFQMAAGMAGISNANELADIIRMGNRASEEQRAQVIQASGVIGQMSDSAAKYGSIASEIYTRVGKEAIPQEWLESGRDLKMGADAQGKITDQQAKNLEKEMELKESTVQAMKAISRIEQLKNDPLLLVLGGLTAIGIGIFKTLGSGLNSITSALQSSSEKSTNRIVEAINNQTNSLQDSMQPTNRHSRRAQRKGRGKKNNQVVADVIETATQTNNAKKTRFQNIKEKFSNIGTNFSDKISNSSIAKSSAADNISKIFKGVGPLLKGASKFLKFLPVIGTLFTGIFEGLSGFLDAEKIFNVAENESATTQQKILAGVGGVVKGMLFGLGDDFVDNTLRNIDDSLNNGILGKVKIIFESLFSNIGSGISNIFDWVSIQVAKLNNALNEANVVWAKIIKTMTFGAIDNVAEKEKIAKESDQAVNELQKSRTESLNKQQQQEDERKKLFYAKQKESAKKDVDTKIKAQQEINDTYKKLGSERAISAYSFNADTIMSDARTSATQYAAKTKESVLPLVNEKASINSAVNQKINAVTQPSNEIKETTTSTENEKTAEQLLSEINGNLVKLLTLDGETQKINKEQLELLTALVETNKSAHDFYKLKHLGRNSNDKFFDPFFNNPINSQLKSI